MANFGDINTDLTVAGGDAIRRNAGDTAWESFTPGSGGSGQTLYDHIVAPSGGDYTTLGAALTAASAGDTIFVRKGTYSENAISNTLADITIVGESPEDSVISITSNTCSINGANITVQNLGFSSTTGNIEFEGHGWRVSGCRFSFSDSGQISLESAMDCIFNANKVICSHTGSATRFIKIRNNNYRIMITNNYFEWARSSVCIEINFAAARYVIANNIFHGKSGSSTGYAIEFINSGANIVIGGNYFYEFGGGTPPAIYTATDAIDSISVSGNIFEGGWDYAVEGYFERSTFSGNVIESPSSGGFYIRADNNSITGNSIYNTTDGVYLNGALANSITGNSMVSVTTGITADATSDNNIFQGNAIDYTSAAISDSGTGNLGTSSSDAHNIEI